MSATPTRLDLDVSVLIATRSRARSLERTLGSLARVDTQGLSWELVVVDNGSTDDTAEVLKRWSQRLPLRSLHVSAAGQNRARNVALPGLRGRLTVLSDDDVCVPRDWVREWVAGTERWPEDVLFGGRIMPRFPPGCAEWIKSERFPFRSQCFAEFIPRHAEGPCDRTPFGPNFAVRTLLLHRFRFREDLGPTAGTYAMGGETELALRLRDHGARVIYLPGACLEHVLAPENLTFDRLCERGFNAGRGDEFRRALHGSWPRALLWLRFAMVLPLKIGVYAALWRASSIGSRSMRLRFLREYRYRSARGRHHQLRLLLQPPAP
jgi:glucosyl-dolichyl phosphate glucuronosyltransferase